MSQLMPINFNQSNPVIFEQSFYQLMEQLAPSQECLQSSTVKACDLHFDTRFILLDLIRKVSASFYDFFTMPFLKSPLAQLNSANLPEDISRFGTENSSLGFAFQVCSNQLDCTDKKVAYILLKSDLSFVKGISGEPEQPYKYPSDSNQLNRLFSSNIPLPVQFFSENKTGSTTYSYLGKEPQNSYTSNLNLMNCHDHLMSGIQTYGISKKVSDYIVHLFGGLKKLCSIQPTQFSFNSEPIDSLFYIHPPLMRKDLSVLFRLCPAAKKTWGKYNKTHPKTICQDPGDAKYVPNPRVKELRTALGESYFEDRSQKPYFLITDVSEDLKSVTTKAETDYSSSRFYRNITERDQRAFQKLLNKEVVLIDGIESQAKADQGNSIYESFIDKFKNEKNKNLAPLKLDQDEK